MSKEEGESGPEPNRAAALPSWAVGAEASGGPVGNPCHSSLQRDSRPGSLVTVTMAVHCSCRCHGNGAARQEPLLGGSYCRLPRCPAGRRPTEAPRTEDRPREGVACHTEGRCRAPSRSRLLTPRESLGRLLLDVAPGMRLWSPLLPLALPCPAERRLRSLSSPLSSRTAEPV